MKGLLAFCFSSLGLGLLAQVTLGAALQTIIAVLTICSLLIAIGTAIVKAGIAIRDSLHGLESQITAADKGNAVNAEQVREIRAHVAEIDRHGCRAHGNEPHRPPTLPVLPASEQAEPGNDSFGGDRS